MGKAAMAMEYIFRKDFRVDSEWSPLLLSKQIDGINYVCTHGHLGLSKKDVTSILFDYGRQGYIQRPGDGTPAHGPSGLSRR